MSHDVNVVTEVECSLVVIRADGTREDLGVVENYKMHPVKKAYHKVKKVLKGGR